MGKKVMAPQNKHISASTCSTRDTIIPAAEAELS